MFYLSGNVKGNKRGVIDTVDGVEEYLTMSELLTAESQGFKVYGIFRKYGYIYCFGVTPLAVELLKRKSPVPVCVRLAKGLGFRQTIYMGHRVMQDHLEFVFFDDSGMSGLCILSNENFMSGSVDLDFIHIDQRRSEVLMRRLKDSGGFAL